MTPDSLYTNLVRQTTEHYLTFRSGEFEGDFGDFMNALCAGYVGALHHIVGQAINPPMRDETYKLAVNLLRSKLDTLDETLTAEQSTQ